MGGNDQTLMEFTKNFARVDRSWLTFTQHAGEILYVPEGWTHATNNSAPCTVAASFQAAHLRTPGANLRARATAIAAQLDEISGQNHFGKQDGDYRRLLDEQIAVWRRLSAVEPT